MRSRQSLLEQFSTFLQMEGDRAGGWATDPRLRRSMQQRLAQTPEAQTSEQFWSIYWHKQWSEATPPATTERDSTGRYLLPEAHLSAYLQETCFWCAQRAVAKVEGVQYRLADCFQVAIAALPKILKAFNSDQLPSLKTYANIAFGNVIRDDLRSRRETDRCNTWGLLLKLSRKQLTEALQAAGLTPAEVEQQQLAWACFGDCYSPQKAPKVRQLTAPDRATWAAIAQQYNQRRSQLAQPGPELTPDTLERGLLTCATRARAYLYPAVASLNAPRPGLETGEIQDDLTADTHESLLAELIAAETQRDRQAQHHTINTVLQTALTALSDEAQALLHAYYRQGLTQQELAKQLNLKQYAISRKLAKAREGLLLALARWSQDTLHISPSSDVIQSMSAILEEWLQAHDQAGGS